MNKSILIILWIKIAQEYNNISNISNEYRRLTQMTNSFQMYLDNNIDITRQDDFFFHLHTLLIETQARNVVMRTSIISSCC